MKGDYEATRWMMVFFVGIIFVTGTISVLSSDLSPILGSLIAACLLVPFVALIDWQMSR